MIGKITKLGKDASEFIGRTLFVDLDNVSGLFIDIKANLAHVEIREPKGSVDIERPQFYGSWSGAILDCDMERTKLK